MVMRRRCAASPAVYFMVSFEGKVVVEYRELLLLVLFSRKVFAYFDSQRSGLHVERRKFTDLRNE